MALRRRRLAPTLLAALLLAPGAQALRAGEPAVRFRGIAEGTAEARANGKPLLLFFTAAWCPSCRDLKDGVNADAGIARLLEERFVPVEVVDRTREDGANPPEVKKLVEAFRVTGLPTIVVFRPGGAAAARQPGYTTREEAFAFLRGALARLEEAEERARRAGR